MTDAATALALGLAALDEAAVHPDHRHGIAIGMVLAGELDGEVVIIAAVQGLDVAVWVALDAGDLARIQAAAGALARGPIQ